MMNDCSPLPPSLGQATSPGASAAEPPATALRIWTLGHSTRSLEQLIELLQHYGIRALADVRRHPGSRRLPQFGQQALAQGLEQQAIAYHWLGETLGGRRQPRPDSPNDGWRNSSFRGYADHLSSPAFAAGLDQLLAVAETQPTAMMCAELLWWRCHRALIADVLKARGVQVIHLQDVKHSTEHPFTSPARLIEGRLDYSADAGQGRLFD